VFFDYIGIEWQYETETFELINGCRYTPDFFLPVSECWVEVKPRELWERKGKCYVIPVTFQRFMSEMGGHALLLRQPRIEEGIDFWGGGDLWGTWVGETFGMMGWLWSKGALPPSNETLLQSEQH